MPVGNVTIHSSSVHNLVPSFKIGRAGKLAELRWSSSRHYATDWIDLPTKTGIPEKETQQHVTGRLIKTISTLAFSLAHDSYLAAIQQHQHLLEFCSWIVCSSLYFAGLSPSWQAHAYMGWETKVTYKQMPLFRYGGMCTHLAADGSTLIFTKKRKRSLSPLYSLATSVAGSLWIFPCPAIFSQVLIFSFCQARSLQPPHYFQRSGLHANCLSMARLPPTYIMHLVSSAQSGLHHFGSFKFRRETDCKCIASGHSDAKEKHTLPVACDCCSVRQNIISQNTSLQCQHSSHSSSCRAAALPNPTCYFWINFTFNSVHVLLLHLPTVWSIVLRCREKAKGREKVTKLIATTWMRAKRDFYCKKPHIDCANCVHGAPRLAVFFFCLKHLHHTGLRRQPCTITMYSSAPALIFSEKEPNGGRKIRQKKTSSTIQMRPIIAP